MSGFINLQTSKVLRAVKPMWGRRFSGKVGILDLAAVGNMELCVC